MRLDAVGVTTSNLTKTVEFYTLLGFEFPEYKPDEDHLEAISKEGAVRLMIDGNQKPGPGTTSAFALLYESPKEVDETFEKVKSAGHKTVTEPWDAFWGQRYAVVSDPDGYKIDLFAYLPK